MNSASSIDVAQHTLLVFAVILSAGAITSFIAEKLRIPDIVLFMLAGIALGPAMAGTIDVPATSALNQIILIFGASYILFDGGATLRFSVLKEVWITVVVIATIGVLITAAITGLAAQWILGLPLITALLLGSTIASTDPATLIPVFRQVRIKDRVAQAVMSESALNDAMGAIITVTLLSLAMGSGHFSLGHSLAELIKESGIGILAGAMMGYLAVVFIAHERLGFLQQHLPLVSLLVVVGAYLGAADFHASGFMGVFVAGLFIGNRESFGYRLTHSQQEGLQDFIETTALIMRMFIFILLGSQVNFGLIKEHLWGALAIVLIFMVVARPLTVFLCAGIDRRARWSRNELLFMCWTRETGVIPGALAGLLLGMRVPGAELIASVTFIAILVTIMLQATTTQWVAKKLNLLEEPPQLPAQDAPGQ